MAGQPPRLRTSLLGDGALGGWKHLPKQADVIHLPTNSFASGLCKRLPQFRQQRRLQGCKAAAARGGGALGALPAMP